ncbi:putative cytosolic Cu/Zn superoxide dismutase [Aspergillus neoniger CBS 115656]|uniref:superoxide dismutase n=1 Tax=Aspergillus neoniger (strain CBS 115656) TaxID=1448310 RepID=A0A318YYU0_ASPNB|nr:cytosolic Cu/Zn superoxide dismutase [Aspergillus neoniger CBS 115656]PYH39836.1 cytosolic Cu/Zn superoxide dismutase [Aspergillus neoniger CBS 115656]
MLFRSALLATALCLSATAAANTNAPVVTDNDDVTYYAQLQPKDNTTVRGSVTILPKPSGVGVLVSAHFWGIPDNEQQLVYHIHQKPVPKDGNCYSTGAHLDPYGRGDATPCDINAPQTCQVGDLSGKHGPIWAPDNEEFTTTYTDWFLSNVEGEPAFFGNLSLVVHAADNSRLACGNFVQLK